MYSSLTVLFIEVLNTEINLALIKKSFFLKKKQGAGNTDLIQVWVLPSLLISSHVVINHSPAQPVTHTI
jgi:hypothetical protein